MRLRFSIWLGTFGVFLWLLSSAYLRTSFGAYAYNESWVLVLAFAIGATATTIGERTLRRLAPHPLCIIACFDMLAGIGCSVVGDAGLSMALLCLHVVCDTILIYCWCIALSQVGFTSRLSAICGSALLAMACVALCWYANIRPSSLAAIASPLLLGCAFLLAHDGRSLARADAESASSVTTEGDDLLHLDHQCREQLSPLSVFILPGACLVCASLFVGIEATFVSNSSIVHRDGFLSVMGCIALVWGIGLISRSSTKFAVRSRLPLLRSLQFQPAAFTLLSTMLLTLVLIAGLTFFSLKLATTFTLAIAFAMGVQAGSTAVFLIAAPHYLSASEIDGRLYTLIVVFFANGMVWGTDLGISLIKFTELSYRLTLNITTVLIAIMVMALAIVITLLLGKQLNVVEVHDTENSPKRKAFNGFDDGLMAIDENGNATIPMENVYAVLRTHQKKQLEPYGLTKREEQIAMLLLDGQSINSIAEQLVITERTVKFHSKNIYLKTGTTNKNDLIAKFVRSDDLIEAEMIDLPALESS